MVYEPLHHKYRPQTLAELVGQTTIATTLTNAIATKKIAPAYLFTGPRGTGKTSSARILAKSLNCLSQSEPTVTPCGECDVCRAIETNSALDVIEIDAASHTGVDNIRSLIERSQFAPVQCRYKIYVIDECHMLSVAAFNALLKTLEEPPDRVVFVLATTDPQRVIPTIISRCQRFDFRRIPIGTIAAHLTKIAQAEGIAITPEALKIVAQTANGGLRDAQSLLDQLSLLSGTITIEQVWELVGAIPEQDLLQLLEAIAANQPAAIIEQVRQLLDRGREPLIVLQSLTGFYRDLLLAKTTPERDDLVALTPGTWQQLCQLAQSCSWWSITEAQQLLQQAQTQLKHTTQPRLWLEMSVLNLATASSRELSKSPDRSVELSTPYNSPQPTANKPSQQQIQSTTSPSAVPLKGSVAAVEQPTSTSEDKPLLRQENPAAKAIASSASPKTISTVKSKTEAATSSQVDSSNTPDSELWQKVLESLKPSLRGMLKQGCLQEFTGELAIVTINKTAMTILQPQIAPVEAAFSQCAGQPVRVRLILDPSLAHSGDRRAASASLVKTTPAPSTLVEAKSTAASKIEDLSDNLTSETTVDRVDLQTATDNLVKMFDAQVVRLELLSESQEDSTNQENKTKLKNRPSIESYLNEADF